MYKGKRFVAYLGANVKICHYARLPYSILFWQSGIDVNTQDTDWNDRTPLHWACLKGHGDIVQLLLKSEADPNLLVNQ